jgi:hypothetical protein
MNPIPPGLRRALIALAGCLMAGDWPVQAQDSVAPDAPPVSALRVLPGQVQPSPVETFRKLLAMAPEERTQSLAIYPSPARERLVEKLEEYQMLPEPMRELRLQVTELRWYLLPLLKLSPTNRAEQLKQVPEPYQKLIAARLEEWDIWPPSLKDEVLEYETTMHYFVGRNAEVQPQTGALNLSDTERSVLEKKLEKWKALPLPERQQMYGAFQHYFELSDAEKAKTLQALSEPERQETAKVVEPIEKWSRPQQEKYLAAFQQFANMPVPERQQFIKNAARWQKMSEAERQAWRDLVKQLADAPPPPLDFIPPQRPPAGSGLSSPISTNPARLH